MENNEMNLNITSDIGSIELATNTLEESIDAFAQHVQKQYAKTRISGDIISNTDSNTMTTMDSDISSLFDRISKSVTQAKTTKDIDQKALKQINDKLEDYQKNLKNIRTIEYKILSADSGRLTRSQYSNELSQDVQHYKEDYSDDVVVARRSLSDIKSIISKSTNAINKDSVSSTFDTELKGRYANAFGDTGTIEDAKQRLEGSVKGREDTITQLKQSISERKNNIKNQKYSIKEVVNVRKSISEDEKRIHDLLLYNSKDLDLMKEIESLETEALESYTDYRTHTESGELKVKASKYSLRGIFQQHAFRLVGSLGFGIGATLQNAIYTGTQLRTSDYNNGVGGTMINLANNGNNSKRLDNTILKGITNIGLKTGTSGTDMSKFLGSYTSTNRTGDVSDYKKQLKGISEFSAYTGAGSDATNSLVSAIGLAGGLNPSSNLNTLYGALMSSNMLSKAPEQTQALSSMINATSNIGNISTSNINSMIGVQQEMASTKNSALQGQQGAQAYTSVSDVVADTNNSLMRNIYSDIFGLDVGVKEQNAKLTYKMENAKKDPTLMAKGIKKLQKYFNNSKEQTAEYLAEHSGGKLSTHQALQLVTLVDKGKLTKKELNKVVKEDKKKTNKSPLQKALEGSGQFKMNFYLSVQQKNNVEGSMYFDGLRGAQAQLFQNHPIANILAQAGGSLAYNLVVDSISGTVQNAIENWSSKRNSKGDDNTPKGTGGSSGTSVDEDNVHTSTSDTKDMHRTQHEEFEKSSRKSRGKHFEKSSGGEHFETRSKGGHFKGFGKSLLANIAFQGGTMLLGDIIDNIGNDDNDDNEVQADIVSSAKSQPSTPKKSSSKSTIISSKHKDKTLENKTLNVWDKAIHVAEMAKTVPQLIHPSKSSNGDGSVGSISGIDSKGIQMLKDIAKKVSEKTGIKAELLFAQMMHETGELSSKVSKEDNNYGGIQYFEGMNDYGVSISSGTVVGDGAGAGTRHYVHFKNANDFATFYANYLMKVYPELKNANTIQDYAQVLKNHGYFEASVSEYTAGMQRYVDMYKSKAYGGFYDNRNIVSMESKVDDNFASYTGRRGFSGSSSVVGTLQMLQQKVKETSEDSMSYMQTQETHIKPKYNVNAQIHNSKYPKEAFISSINKALEQHVQIISKNSK